MKSVAVFSWLCLILPVSIALRSEDASPTAANILTVCGEAMRADSGFIEYKLNQTYRAGEICAFIVEMDKHDGCNFTLETHGINDVDWEAITVYRLWTTEENLQSVKFGPDRPRSAYLAGSSFVVVFNPKTDLGTGFRLKFESGTMPINKYTSFPFIFNNERMFPLVFPLKVAGIYEWNPVVVTSRAQLLTNESFELVLTGNYLSDVYGCSFWYGIHSLVGDKLEFIDTYTSVEPGETFRFKSRGLFIVVFFKNDKCSQENTGALDWLETV